MSFDQIIKFKKICEMLGITLKEKDNFNKRFLIQKTFYFGIKLGIDLDLKFEFYKYGPYSSYLTDIYYSVLEIPEDALEGLSNIHITSEEIKIIEILKRILNKWKSNLKKLEYYASLLYVFEDMYIKNQNLERVQETIKKLKPALYKNMDFKHAIRELQSEGFIEKLINYA